jgi:hypothetical protein
MSGNIWTKFKGMLPSESVSLGEVISHNSDGTSTVELLGGERIRPIGQLAAIGNRAMVKKGQVIAEAPALTQYDLIIL